MLKYPQLSKLPKAPRFKSLNFRGQSPGSPAVLISPWNTSKNLLDPSHPLAARSRQSFPSSNVPALGVRAFPIALLEKPETPWPHPFAQRVDTWDARLARTEPGDEIAPMLLSNAKPGRIGMSLLTATSKKRTSKKKCVRLKISRKIKTAITLIVVRGAQVSEKGLLMLDADEAREKGDMWILPGWSYLFFPTLEIYRMEYPELVTILRNALRRIWETGKKMESALPAKKPLPSPNTQRSPPSSQERQPRIHNGRSGVTWNELCL
ncbi:hypothetical protein BD779DRAFT_1785659 [Infundibulicybe gibba]|nr:hypothetical protein BD779DRAFT_1785659 [Infundibulicybe gibba]